MQKKIYNHCNGSIIFPNNDYKFLNLSDHELTQSQKDILNLCPTCYLFKGFVHVQNKQKLKFYIGRLQEQNQVKTKSQLRDLLKAKATKNRSNNKHKYSTILIPQLKNDVEQLHKYPDFTIKKSR